jgi:hypothetical protein
MGKCRVIMGKYHVIMGKYHIIMGKCQSYDEPEITLHFAHFTKT